MIKYIAGYVAAMIAMMLLDTLWIGFIAAEMYQSGIGHLMATKPNLIAALVFYIIFIAGLMVFAIAPAKNWQSTIKLAALYGFFTYSTYELTNMATLRNWPIGMSLIDIAWGVFICVVSANVGRSLFKRFH